MFIEDRLAWRIFWCYHSSSHHAQHNSKSSVQLVHVRKKPISDPGTLKYTLAADTLTRTHRHIFFDKLTGSKMVELMVSVEKKKFQV